MFHPKDFFDVKLKKGHGEEEDGEAGEAANADEVQETPRHCGDLCFLSLFVALWIALIVIAVVTGIRADPQRLTRGTDMFGNLCGVRPLKYADISNDVLSAWDLYDYVWYPLSTDASIPQLSNETGTVADSLKLGVCVMLKSTSPASNTPGECPKPGEQVSVYGNKTAVATWNVTYNSRPYLGRCLPIADSENGVSEATLHSVRELQNLLDISSFWFEGVAEIKNTHRVLVVSGFLGSTYALLWCFFLRTSIRFTTYGTLLTFAGFLGGAGWIAWHYANDLEDDEKGNGNLEIRTSHWWRVFAVVMWIGIAVMGGVAWYLHNRMAKIIAIIKQGLRVQSHIMGLALVPVWGFILICALTTFMCFVAVNIETSDDIVDDKLVDGNLDVFDTVVLREWTFRAYFHVLNILMWAWSIGFAHHLCYCVISFCTVFWYFSSRGDLKEAPEGIGSRGLHTACKYHLGTIAFGSLVMFFGSIFKMIFYFLKFPCGWVSNQRRKGCCGWCLCNCFVNCYENRLRFVSQHAYIMTAMMGTGFCNSGKQARQLIDDEKELVGGKLKDSVMSVNLVSDAVIITGKLLITTMNVVFSWLMIENNWEELAPDVRNPTLPLILIGCATYLVTTLFIDITAAVVDNLILCFCYDRSINAETGDYFMPTGIRAAMLGDGEDEASGLLAPPTDQGEETWDANLPAKGARNSITEVCDALGGTGEIPPKPEYKGASDAAILA